MNDILLNLGVVNEEEIIIKAEQLLAESRDNLTRRNEAIEQVVELLINLPDAIGWFNKHSIPLFGINTNPDQHTWTHSPKAYADIYRRPFP